MRKHIEHESPSIALAIIPAGPIGRLLVSVEHPASAFQPYFQDAPEPPGVAQQTQLAEARQEHLVLHRAVLHTDALRRAGQVQRLLQRARDRLFTVDMFSGFDRPAHHLVAAARGRGIEE